MKKILFTLALTFGLFLTAGESHHYSNNSHSSYAGHRSYNTHSSYAGHRSYNTHRSYAGHRSYNTHRSSGYYSHVRQRIWVAGHARRIWISAHYENRYDHHSRSHRRVLISAGHYENRHTPGHYTYQTVRVWHAR